MPARTNIPIVTMRPLLIRFSFSENLLKLQSAVYHVSLDTISILVNPS
jgi:hypothetical protein